MNELITLSGTLLVDGGEPGVLVELLVKILKLEERLLVVGRSALREDLYAEVRLLHLALVVLLVIRRRVLSLPL